MLNISGLKEGVVLDHIQAGKSMDICWGLPHLPGGSILLIFYKTAGFGITLTLLSLGIW